MDQGNQFFSKQANILNTSHKRHRRGVSSPGTEFLFLNNNEKVMNQSAILYTEHKSGTAANGTAPEIASQQQDRDQFNFTFFKDRSGATTAADQSV